MATRYQNHNDTGSKVLNLTLFAPLIDLMENVNFIGLNGVVFLLQSTFEAVRTSRLSERRLSLHD
jgi:hypothetical protein